MNTVTNSYDTSAVLPQMLLVEVRQQPNGRFGVFTNFLLFSLRHTYVETSRWKKVANKFIGAILYYVTSKFFNVPAKNSFPVLTFIPIY